ncbi:hypothetical protein P3S67_011419 [Capsicum chacoense]
MAFRLGNELAYGARRALLGAPQQFRSDNIVPELGTQLTSENTGKLLPTKVGDTPSNWSTSCPLRKKKLEVKEEVFLFSQGYLQVASSICFVGFGNRLRLISSVLTCNLTCGRRNISRYKSLESESKSRNE